MPPESPPPEILDALRRMHLLGAARRTGRAPHRRRVVGHLAHRSSRRPDLREARPRQAARRRRMARTGRAQSLRSRLDAARQCRGPRHCPRAARSGRTSAVHWRWNSCPPPTIRYGRRNCATATPIPLSQRRSRRRWRASMPLPRPIPATAAQFPTDTIFFDIRLEPYLLATGARTPRSRARAWKRSSRPHRTPSAHWCTAMSARRTSLPDRAARCSSTRSAPGGAIPRSTSRSASTTCC